MTRREARRRIRTAKFEQSAGPRLISHHAPTSEQSLEEVWGRRARATPSSELDVGVHGDEDAIRRRFEKRISTSASLSRRVSREELVGLDAMCSILKKCHLALPELDQIEESLETAKEIYVCTRETKSRVAPFFFFFFLVFGSRERARELCERKNRWTWTTANSWSAPPPPAPAFRRFFLRGDVCSGISRETLSRERGSTRDRGHLCVCDARRVTKRLCTASLCARSSRLGTLSLHSLPNLTKRLGGKISGRRLRPSTRPRRPFTPRARAAPVDTVRYRFQFSPARTIKAVPTIRSASPAANPAHAPSSTKPRHQSRSFSRKVNENSHSMPLAKVGDLVRRVSRDASLGPRHPRYIWETMHRSDRYSVTFAPFQKTL